MGKNQHVTYNSDDKTWNVRGEGNSKATRVTDTKQQAVDIAREIARNQESELIIHGKDNKFQSRDSYGNDPFPPEG
ncbi:MAG: DUF2188 domain-containing protein [Ruminiclostridium sp.]